MESILEISTHEGEGYAPVVTYGSWRVAMIRDSVYTHRDTIKSIARHLLTDEVFVLSEGKANLYFADGSHAPGVIKKITLETGKAYNVKAGTWHVVETFDDTCIFVVENDDTNTANSEKFPVTSDMLK